MEKIIMDVEKEIGRLKGDVSAAHKRIDELTLITKAFYELASDVKILVNEMTTMKKDITEIKSDIEAYHHKEPDKLIFNAKNAIMVGVIGALVSAFMALILK